MHAMRSTIGLVLAAGCAMFLSGCGSSPPVRYFTLDSSEAPRPVSVAPLAPLSIVVGPVSVPEIVDRPHIVLRSATHRVEIAEFARWAAPLKAEVPRVIAEHLGRFVSGARTSTFSERATGVPDYRVAIDIQRFESSPGEAALQALWTVRPRSGDPLTGQSSKIETAGLGYDALVAAHGRALRAVAEDIAAAITAIQARPSGAPPASAPSTQP